MDVKENRFFSKKNAFRKKNSLGIPKLFEVIMLSLYGATAGQNTLIGTEYRQRNITFISVRIRGAGAFVISTVDYLCWFYGVSY